MTVDELNGTHIRGTIVTLLDDHIPGIEEEIMSLEMYFISHETKVIQFGSIIASMVVNQCPKVYACLDIEQLVNIHNRSFSETLLENNMTMYIWVELSGLVAEQQETDKSVSGKAFSKFYYSVRNNIDNTCIGKEGVNFKKTHVCPFVEISKADMAILVDDMKNTNESGLVFLESWEYEDLEYQWRICFNDFIYIQVRARRRSIVPMDQKGEGRNSVSIAVSLNCICFVFFMVIHC